MTIYIVQVLLILIMGLLCKPNRSEKRKRYYLFFFFLLLASVSGFRAFSVGSDTKVYVGFFELVQNGSAQNSRYELGFNYYVRLLHRLSDDPGILLIVSSVFSIGSVVLFIKKHSKDVVLSLALYILLGGYFWQMTAMRQVLAESLTMAAVGLLLWGRQRVSIIAAAGFLVLLATLFHTAAWIVFLPFLLIVIGSEKRRETRYYAWEILAISFSAAVVCFAVYPLIMNGVSKLVPGFASYFRGTWSDANYNASLFKTLVSVAFMAAGTAVFRNKRLNRNQSVAIMMLGASVIFNTLSMRMEIWGRLSGFFSPYIYLLWAPEFVSEIRNQKNRGVIKGCILLFSAAYMLIVLVFRPEWTRVVPYLFRE